MNIHSFFKLGRRNFSEFCFASVSNRFISHPEKHIAIRHNIEKTMHIVFRPLFCTTDPTIGEIIGIFILFLRHFHVFNSLRARHLNVLQSIVTGNELDESFFLRLFEISNKIAFLNIFRLQGYLLQFTPRDARNFYVVINIMNIGISRKVVNLLVFTGIIVNDRPCVIVRLDDSNDPLFLRKYMSRSLYKVVRVLHISVGITNYLHVTRNK